jgi:hypothetical protein
MRKQRTEYSSPVDALVAVSKRLGTFENRRSMTSEDFIDRYRRGQLGDDAELVDWANDYAHYLAIRSALEARLSDAA